MNFWDQLVASGNKAAAVVLDPLTNGVSKSFGNLVLAGQQKVGQLAQTITQKTDPNNRSTESQPASPPTTGTAPAAAAKTTTTVTLMVLAALVALYFFMRKKNG